jgi:hypothetical protein
VIVEIRQQRGARSAYGRMDIAIDPRRHHGYSLGVILGGESTCRSSNVPPTVAKRKGKHRPTTARTAWQTGGLSSWSRQK